MQRPPELTLKAVALGLLLALIFGAANAYLGMKAGQTVSATIPAAVIAMALFRLPRVQGGILEQNIARTGASVGEALVAGAIFTIPAFVLLELNGERLWTSFEGHYLEASAILLAGGMTGIFFAILLRRALVTDPGLPFPESVASYEIVKAGEKAGGAARLIFGAMGFGGLIQYLKTSAGLQIFKEYLEGYLPFPKSVIGHFDFDKKPLASVPHAGGVPWTTPALSPALLGIGYLIGPKYASINFAGGVLAWWILIPLLLFFDPDFARRIGDEDPAVSAYTIWYNVIRPFAVGTMLVAAANTMFRMRAALGQSLKGVFTLKAPAATEGVAADPREADLPFRWVAFGLLALLPMIAAVYYRFTHSAEVAAAASVALMLLGFLLSAAGCYLVGLVGASNQPLSGLTLAALLITALAMVLLGATGIRGAGAVLGVAAVACVAGSVSGSLIQDLKAGQLLGGTPWKMQVVQIVAVLLLAAFLMLPILALHQANADTGGIGGRALPAPQAGLMAQLSRGIVGGQMAWGLLAMGIAFGVFLILCGASSPMMIAVGMYLPFDTTSAVFAGGMLKWLASRAAAGRSGAERAEADERGTLIASGLVAGEAILGILLAAAFLTGAPSLTRLLTGADRFEWFPAWGGWLSGVAFAALAWLLVRVPLSMPASNEGSRS